MLENKKAEQSQSTHLNQRRSAEPTYAGKTKKISRADLHISMREDQQSRPTYFNERRSAEPTYIFE